MIDGVEITGGAGPAEAAAVVAVITHILEVEHVASVSRPRSHRPPAWMRAAFPRDPDDPLDIIIPDHRGDPL
jgi:hypothetical protein